MGWGSNPSVKWRGGGPRESGVGSTAGTVYLGEWATTWHFPYSWLLTISVFSATSRLFPYNWLLVISVFPRAKLMYLCYFSLLLVIIYVGSWPHRTI